MPLTRNAFCDPNIKRQTLQPDRDFLRDAIGKSLKSWGIITSPSCASCFLALRPQAPRRARSARDFVARSSLRIAVAQKSLLALAHRPLPRDPFARVMVVFLFVRLGDTVETVAGLRSLLGGCRDRHDGAAVRAAADDRLVAHLSPDGAHPRPRDMARRNAPALITSPMLLVLLGFAGKGKSPNPNSSPNARLTSFWSDPAS